MRRFFIFKQGGMPLFKYEAAKLLLEIKKNGMKIVGPNTKVIRRETNQKK